MLLAASATPPPPLLQAVPSSSLLLAATVPGPQFEDIFYIGGVFLALAFGGRQVFDSVFAEDTNEYKPPMPTIFGKVDAQQDSAAAAEDLRQRLMVAAEAGDLETAFRLEKELKNLLAESGVRYIVDDDENYSAKKEEKLPKVRWRREIYSIASRDADALTTVFASR